MEPRVKPIVPVNRLSMKTPLWTGPRESLPPAIVLARSQMDSPAWVLTPLAEH